MMKSILFIIPWKASLVGDADYVFAEYPERAPENVVSLATWLASKGVPVKIADMTRMLVEARGDVSAVLESLAAMCGDFRPDVVGLSFFTARFAAAAEIVSCLRAYYKTAPETAGTPLIIAGGVHPTLLPDVTYEYIDFDALMIGEGELSLLELLSGKPLDQIRGVCLKGQGKPVQADVVTDLDEIPFPDWSLVDKEFYSQPSRLISNVDLHRVMPVTFSRACMYRCNFCAHNSFLAARCHTPEYFVEMLHDVSRQCNVRHFLIQDSSVGSFKEKFKQVCRLLIEAGSPYRWWANLRVNQADEEFLTLMKDAGCSKVFFGFESGSQRMLDRMNKKITVEQCERAAEICHRIGLHFYSSYIVNYFGETEEDLQATEDLIRRTRPDSLAVNKFSPIPGSVDYDRIEETIRPMMTSIRAWTDLGMLLAPALFGDMEPERFEWWYRRLRDMKRIINSNEAHQE